MANFSILSRGTGARRETKSGHRKIEILLDPTDYFLTTTRLHIEPKNPATKSYDVLPPIDNSYESQVSKTLPMIEPTPKKTYITRKGELVLFSENFANSVAPFSIPSNAKRRRKSLEPISESQPLTYEEGGLGTCGDLCKSILTYGPKDKENEEVYLQFNLKKSKFTNEERKMRPGFSAKRYMNKWSFTWDPNMFQNLRNQGKLTDKTLFGALAGEPTYYKRLHYDLSQQPFHYRIASNMLMDTNRNKKLLSWEKKQREAREEAENLEIEASEILKSNSSMAPIIRDTSMFTPRKPLRPSTKHNVDYKDSEFEQKVEFLADLLVQTSRHDDKQKEEKALKAKITPWESESYSIPDTIPKVEPKNEKTRDVESSNNADKENPNVTSAENLFQNLETETPFSESMEAWVKKENDIIENEKDGIESLQKSRPESPESIKSSIPSAKSQLSDKSARKPKQKEQKEFKPLLSTQPFGEGLPEKPPSQSSFKSLKGSKLKATIPSEAQSRSSSSVIVANSYSQEREVVSKQSKKESVHDKAYEEFSENNTAVEDEEESEEESLSDAWPPIQKNQPTKPDSPQVKQSDVRKEELIEKTEVPMIDNEKVSEIEVRSSSPEKVSLEEKKSEMETSLLQSALKQEDKVSHFSSVAAAKSATSSVSASKPATSSMREINDTKTDISLPTAKETVKTGFSSISHSAKIEVDSQKEASRPDTKIDKPIDFKDESSYSQQLPNEISSLPTTAQTQKLVHDRISSHKITETEIEVTSKTTFEEEKIRTESRISSAVSMASEEDDNWANPASKFDEAKAIQELIKQEKEREKQEKKEKERLAKEAAEKEKLERQRVEEERKLAEQREREAEEEARLEKIAKEEAERAKLEAKKKKEEAKKAKQQEAEKMEKLNKPAVDMFASAQLDSPTVKNNSAFSSKPTKALKGAKKAPKLQQKTVVQDKKKDVFSDVKDEKGVFVMVPGGEFLNVGHELEMKEKLIENMKNLYSSILAKNLLKKLRGKKGLYRRATLIAAAVLSQMYSGTDFNFDAKVAARLWGTKLAEILGEEDEMEYYIDPETGELRQRPKRKEIPKLEVFVDPLTGKMYIVTDSGERMEVFTDPKTGKLMFRTKSGKVHELPSNMQIYTDPITGKVYIGEKKDPGMEVFTDPVTGKMFIKTKDGKTIEVWKDPATGKVYMRTESGKLKELPEGMSLYVDPETGIMYIGEKPPGPPNMEVFTDPVTGKKFIRTEDGEILEVVEGEDGKIYLRTKSGKLRELPPDFQLSVDPVTGKIFLGTTGKSQGAKGEEFEMFTDPETGKTYIKTKDGEVLEVYTDPNTGKVYLRTKSGTLKEMPADMEMYTDPVTGKKYLRQTKDPGLEMFTDPVTGKTYVRTKDGEVLEVVVGEDGKTYLRTKSGNLKELGDHLEVYVDPITGKTYIGERRNKGMEMFTDPDTGITYVKTADGQILEMWTDPNTGKVYLRTKSGRVVSEVDENMVMYTDPVTGKKYLAPKGGAPQSSVFTDPNTGKMYIRTKSGRIVEAKMEEEEMELYVDPVTGKTYLRTKSGTLKELPADGEIIKDPITGKVYLRTKSGRLTEIAGDVDIFVDPTTGKTYVSKKGKDGDIEVLTDPATGKMYVRTACGKLTELVSDGNCFFDPTTGKNYIRTKSGRLHELNEDCEMFIDPETGKLFMRTKSGKLHEVGDDVNMFTDPITGKTYVRTTSGRFMELDPDMEVTIDPITGKMFVRTKSGTLKELAAEMETYIDPITGKKIVRPKGGVGLGFELYVDPETGKTYMRQRDDLLDDIDLDKLSPAERRRVEMMRMRKQKERERKEREREAELDRQASIRARLEQEMIQDKIREEIEAKEKEAALQRQLEEEEREQNALRLAKEAEEAALAEQSRIDAMEEAQRLAYEMLQKEREEWEKQQQAIAEANEKERLERQLEEARLLATELARKQAETEARALFNQSLRMEMSYYQHNQMYSRAFIYSYFELMRLIDDLSEED